MEQTTYTTDQTAALDKVLTTNRRHASRNGEWMSLNHVDRPGEAWPAVVGLCYWISTSDKAVAHFPGLSSNQLAQALARHHYFTTNLGGVDVMAPRTI